MEMQQFYYDNKIVKKFIYATIVFGVVGMLVGLLLALINVGLYFYAKTLLAKIVHQVHLNISQILKTLLVFC